MKRGATARVLAGFFALVAGCTNAADPTAGPGSATNGESAITAISGPGTTSGGSTTTSFTVDGYEPLPKDLPVACRVATVDEPGLVPTGIPSVFSVPETATSPLVPGAQRIARVTSSGQSPTESPDDPSPRVAVGQPWPGGLRPVTFSNPGPFRDITVVGRHDRASGVFEPLFAVDGCRAPDLNPPVVTDDGVLWVPMQPNGLPFEVLRVEPSGAAEIVGHGPFGSVLAADGNRVHAIARAVQRNAGSAPAVISTFDSDGRVSEPVLVDLALHTVWAAPWGVAVWGCSREGPGTCSVWILDPASGSFQATADLDKGWGVVGPGQDGVWIFSDDAVQLLAADDLSVITTIDIAPDGLAPRSYNDGGSRPSLFLDGSLLITSDIDDGTTVTVDVLEPSGNRTEILRYESYIRRVSRDPVGRRWHANLTAVDGGLEYFGTDPEPTDALVDESELFFVPVG